MAQYEAAKTLTGGETVHVLVDPTGTIVGAFSAGSGKKVPPHVRRRAAAILRDILPDVVRGKSRRTSRPSTIRSRTKPTGKVANRRTSRMGRPRRAR